MFHKSSNDSGAGETGGLPAGNPADKSAPADGLRISVIIPTLNEEANLPRCFPEGAEDSVHEVIVADGGSRDATREVAARRGWRVCETEPGRARQMNAGAKLATGDVLVFLHADTVLPENFDAQVRRVLSTPGVAAGAFRLRCGAGGWGLRVIERLANLRSRWLGLPYGDQAIFLRADVFRELGGYREIAIMEDVELIRRLSKRGRIRTAPAVATTSARRWERCGVWRTSLRNLYCLLSYFAGVSPERIRAFYYRDRA